jgi:type 1 glutamine amidotransferase
MRRLLVVGLALAVLGSVAGAAAQATGPRVLVFTKTTGHRHDSIPVAIQAVRELGARNGFLVTATEDAATFSASGLAPYDAVIFLLTSGEILDAGQQAAFEAYLRGGRGYVGVHSAADTERGWPWYGRLVGAWSSGHPEIQPATLDVVLPREGSTAALPARWSRTDEWYSWQTNPRTAGVRVLLTLDESTYMPREFAMGADHPIAWQHEFEGGRAWYTQGGHTDESYSEPLFLGHLLGGIQWALARPAAAEGPKAPAAVAPRFTSITTKRDGRRVAVRVLAERCPKCTARLVVRGRSSALRRVRGALTATTAALPPGRWRVAVVLTDPATGLSRTTRVWVTVPRP